MSIKMTALDGNVECCCEVSQIFRAIERALKSEYICIILGNREEGWIFVDTHIIMTTLEQYHPYSLRYWNTTASNIVSSYRRNASI